MTISDDFKKALSEMPDKEKDKLLFRLIKKDSALTKRLYFALMQPASVEDLREETLKSIHKQLDYVHARFYSPGYAMMSLRDASGLINEHLSTTKDKYGEIYLQLNMLDYFLEHNLESLQLYSYNKQNGLNIYIIARLYKLLGQLLSLHEDLRYDFKEILETIAQNIGKTPTLMETAIHNGFDVNWLFNYEIPEDIVQTQKELRANGYLK
jgi:hypothetical protein